MPAFKPQSRRTHSAGRVPTGHRRDSDKDESPSGLAQASTSKKAAEFAFGAGFTSVFEAKPARPSVSEERSRRIDKDGEIEEEERFRTRTRQSQGLEINFGKHKSREASQDTNSDVHVERSRLQAAKALKPQTKVHSDYQSTDLDESPKSKRLNVRFVNVKSIQADEPVKGDDDDDDEWESGAESMEPSPRQTKFKAQELLTPHKVGVTTIGFPSPTSPQVREHNMPVTPVSGSIEAKGESGLWKIAPDEVRQHVQEQIEQTQERRSSEESREQMARSRGGVETLEIREQLKQVASHDAKEAEQTLTVTSKPSHTDLRRESTDVSGTTSPELPNEAKRRSGLARTSSSGSLRRSGRPNSGSLGALAAITRVSTAAPATTGVADVTATVVATLSRTSPVISTTTSPTESNYPNRRTLTSFVSESDSPVLGSDKTNLRHSFQVAVSNVLNEALVAKSRPLSQPARPSGHQSFLYSTFELDAPLSKTGYQVTAAGHTMSNHYLATSHAALRQFHNPFLKSLQRSGLGADECRMQKGIADDDEPKVSHGHVERRSAVSNMAGSMKRVLSGALGLS